ncbi:helix-turn-helix transcriptional regulator [Reichenbachiella sp.]|uniref:helix-turn-helix domain-containing protein n=1 Tax=Reichenbachiella sp. TaxID=2184521 RepID=UPI00329A2F03
MDKDQELKGIGDKVRSARIAKGLSQTKLAYSIGKDQPSINRLEKGNVNPSYLYLLEICEGLEITLSELLEIKD